MDPSEGIGQSRIGKDDGKIAAGVTYPPTLDLGLGVELRAH